MQADLVEVAASRIAGAVGLDQQQRRALRPFLGVGLDDDDGQLGMLAVGDVGLRSIDDIVVALLDRGGADALEVGSGAGLGHRDRGRGFARDHPRQPVQFLLLAAVADEIIGDDVRMERDPRRRAGVTQFLVDHRVIAEVEPQSAIGFGHRRAEQSSLSAFGPEITVDDALLFPPVEVRNQFLGEEAPHGIAECFMIVVEGGAAAGVEHHISFTRIGKQRQQGKTRQPMFAGIIAGEVGQRRLQMLLGGSVATARSVAKHGRDNRQHHARLRLSPSRWAILPSLRSLTIGGVNRVAGWRSATPRKEAAEPLLEVRPRLGAHMHKASISAGDRNSSPPGSHAWQSRSPPNQSRRAWRIAAASSGRIRSPIRSPGQREGRVEMGADADRVSKDCQIMAQPRCEGAGERLQICGPWHVRVARRFSMEREQPRPAIGPLESARQRTLKIGELALDLGFGECVVGQRAQFPRPRRFPETGAEGSAGSTSHGRSCASRSCHRRSDGARAAAAHLRRQP